MNEEAGIERRVEDIVREVSEPSGSGSTKITLKPSLYGEVSLSVVVSALHRFNKLLGVIQAMEWVFRWSGKLLFSVAL